MWYKCNTRCFGILQAPLKGLFCRYFRSSRPAISCCLYANQYMEMGMKRVVLGGLLAATAAGAATTASGATLGDDTRSLHISPLVQYSLIDAMTGSQRSLT